jgi:hypothetical protein
MSMPPRTPPRFGRRAVLAALGACALPGMARETAPVEIAAALSAARLSGRTRMRWFGVLLYDIRLWVGDGFDGAGFARHRLALEIEYARDFAGDRLAAASIEQMHKLAPIAPARREAWLADLTGTLPDVRAGDRLTGLQLPGEGARFFHNGQLLGELRDGDFARAFFAIWLSPASSAPQLRRALLGAAT